MIRRVQTADVVVIGSGAFGASTAYHLARRGARVALLDQHALASQTSPRAAGLTSKAAASSPVMAELRHEAVEALERWEAETGQSIDFHRSGSLKAAYTEPGEARLRRDLALTRELGAEAELVSAPAARRMAPHFEPGDARAIGHVPSDGWINPAGVAIGFATAPSSAAPRPCRSRARDRAARARRTRGRRDHDPRRGPGPGGRGRGRRVDVVGGGGARPPAAAGRRAASALRHRAPRRRRAPPAHRAAARGQRVRPPRGRRPDVRRLRGPSRRRGRGQPAAGISDLRSRAGPRRAARAGGGGGRALPRAPDGSRRPAPRRGCRR